VEAARVPTPKAPMTREEALQTIKACSDYHCLSWKKIQVEVTRLCHAKRGARGFSPKHLSRLAGKK